MMYLNYNKCNFAVCSLLGYCSCFIQFIQFSLLKWPGLNNKIMSWSSTKKAVNGLSSKGNNHVAGNHDLCVKYLLKQRKNTKKLSRHSSGITKYGIFYPGLMGTRVLKRKSSNLSSATHFHVSLMLSWFIIGYDLYIETFHFFFLFFSFFEKQEGLRMF